MYNQNDLHKLSALFQAFGFGFCPGLAFGSNPVSDIHRKNLENLNQETVQLGNREITSVDFTDNAVLLAALGRYFNSSPGWGGGSQPALGNKPHTLKNLRLHHQVCSGAAGCKNNPKRWPKRLANFPKCFGSSRFTFFCPRFLTYSRLASSLKSRIYH